MKTITNIPSLILGITLIAVLSFSCNKNENNGNQSRIQLRLVDNPIPDVKEVWVDIKAVELTMNGDNSVILNNIYPGVYNLLELTNGKDTLLADATIPAGSISQLRLILGSNNYIITSGGEKIDLTTPSAEQSGLKVQVHQDVEGGLLYRLTLDFDAARSIVKAGNSGKYILKPVLRIISFVPSGGNLRGVIMPDSVRTQVIAIKGADTIAATFSNVLDGNWLIKDIPAGAYSLSFIPADTTYNMVQTNAVVTLGGTTVVDTVRLQN